MSDTLADTFIECQTISPGYEHKRAFWYDVVGGSHSVGLSDDMHRIIED
jgi:hypothetical protein